MTPQEANIIRDVFTRIRANGPVPADAQARAAIDVELRANPDAAIGLVQMVVGLDQQRAQLAAERDQLAAQVNALQGRGASGGGLFGTSLPGYQPAPPPPPQQPGPWTQQPQASGPWGAPQQPSGGGFLRTALGAATGMAGGLFAVEALRGIFGGHNGGLFGTGGYNTTEIIRDTEIIHDRGSSSDPFGSGSSVDSGPSGGFDTASDDGGTFGSSDDDSTFG